MTLLREEESSTTGGTRREEMPSMRHHRSQSLPELNRWRTLLLMFRRDRTRDRQEGRTHFAGFRIMWPDGKVVTLGLESFCDRGQRLLGLDRHMIGHESRLIKLICAPVLNENENIVRMPGHRVRRFFLQRSDRMGRLYFMNGSPTETVFDLDRDDPQILQWIGLTLLENGDRQWLDLVAAPAE